MSHKRFEVGPNLRIVGQMFQGPSHAEYVVSGDAVISTALPEILHRSTFLLCFPSAFEEALRVLMIRMSCRLVR